MHPALLCVCYLVTFKNGGKNSLLDSCQKYAVVLKFTRYHANFWNQMAINNRVGPTGFLQSDDDAKLKIDEFWYELWNSV